MNDLLTLLTGFKYTNDVPKEELSDEHYKRLPNFPTAGTDEELQDYRERMTDANYREIERAFKKLWGYPDRIVPETEIDLVPFLVEKNFTQNIGEVTGQESEFFGKMLYHYFSNGYDKAKISMQKFFEKLMPFTDDDER